MSKKFKYFLMFLVSGILVVTIGLLAHNFIGAYVGGVLIGMGIGLLTSWRDYET